MELQTTVDGMSDTNEDVTHTYEPNGAQSFVMVIAQEGVKTIDGREFTAGALTWREPPISLMMIRDNDPTGRGGHKASSAVASITEIWRKDDADGFGTIYGRGYFATDEQGMVAHDLIAQGVISGVSADVGGATYEELEATDEGVSRKIKTGTIIAVTALPMPAFDGTKISTSDESIIAASGPSDWAPLAEWFQDPKLTLPTPITVTADGRVSGHAAVWGTCHVGYRDKCVTPPRSKSGYQYFNVGQVITADGSAVNVGRLTAGTGHAGLEFGATPAKEHYDNTGWAAAYVHAGEDEHGIWFAGAISPSATPEQIATLRASSTSGDWRSIQNNLEMVGILAVNTPGFPLPRAKAGLVAGAQISLIASGVCPCESDEFDADVTVDIVEVTDSADPIEDDSSDIAATLARADLAMADYKVAKVKAKQKAGKSWKYM